MYYQLLLQEWLHNLNHHEIDSYDKKPCDKGREYDKSKYKEKSNININKINCNSVNYNVIDNVNGNNNIGNDNREERTAN